jgi:hypothetical protein
MSIVFKSLIGTLAVVSTLAGTVGATLYVGRWMDFAIHDAVAQQLAELQSEEEMRHVGINCEEADPSAWAAFEEMNQPPGGALMDSRVVAVLIDQLCEASPQERDVWTQLLRRPESHESYRSLLSYYHGKSPGIFERTSEQAPAAAVIQRASMPPSPSLPGGEIPGAANSTAMPGSAIEALRMARHLLLEQALSEELSALCERHERLIESQPQSQPVREAPAGPSHSPTHFPD